MKLYITRHGETVDNVRGIVQGHKHGELTLVGINQARRLGKRLSDIKIDIIFSSDLKRAKDTAVEIGKFLSGVDIIFDERIRERDYGRYTDMSRDDIDWDEVDKGIGCESIFELKKRLNSFFLDISRQHADENVLIVTHGTAAKNLFSVMIEKPFFRKLNNASLSIVDVDCDGNADILTYNCIDHLN